CAEAFEAAAGARAVDLRCLVARRFGELLADRGGKGIHGRGPDRADIVARAAARRRLILARGKRQRARRRTSDKGKFLEHREILSRVVTKPSRHPRGDSLSRQWGFCVTCL